MPAEHLSSHLTTGFFGKIPAAGDFITWNLPRLFTERWDRWMSMELRARPDEGELDPRVWRFNVPAGIFGEQAASGAWRMSEDRAGRRFPLVVAGLGAPPAPSDPWFDGVTAALRGAVEDFRPAGWLAEHLGSLPAPQVKGANGAIAFWLDDWEVQELGFADIHDLADNGLPAMRAARLDVGGP